MGIRKFGTEEPISTPDDDEPQGINVTAARRDSERPDPREIIEEGEDVE
jgi:hypothetical protein